MLSCRQIEQDDIQFFISFISINSFMQLYINFFFIRMNERNKLKLNTYKIHILLFIFYKFSRNHHRQFLYWIYFIKEKKKEFISFESVYIPLSCMPSTEAICKSKPFSFHLYEIIGATYDITRKKKVDSPFTHTKRTKRKKKFICTCPVNVLKLIHRYGQRSFHWYSCSLLFLDCFFFFCLMLDSIILVDFLLKWGPYLINQNCFNRKEEGKKRNI